MAITWPLEIIPINIPAKEAKIIATRIDDEDPDNPRVYTLPSITLSTQSKQLTALDRIWEMHINALAYENDVSNFLTDLAAQGKANLEARE